MRTLLGTGMLLALMTPLVNGQHRADNHPFATRSEVVARHGSTAWPRRASRWPRRRPSRS